MNSAPDLIRQPENGDNVLLINAIYELRDTELSFYKDIRFTLDEVAATIHTNEFMLFGGLQEIAELSNSLYIQEGVIFI
jgi:hypothetical protein